MENRIEIGIIPFEKRTLGNILLGVLKQSLHFDMQNLVSVEFFNKTSLDELVETFSGISNPHVILWYIGCYGLKKEGAEFYKNFVINPLRKRNSNASFWLIDLTAWNAFKVPGASIQSYNGCCSLIESLSRLGINCVKSSRIFEKICEIKPDAEGQYLKKALSRDFLKHASQKFSQNHVLIEEIFPCGSWIAKEFSGWDAAKAYSIFQYLEAYFLIDEIVSRINFSSKCKSLELLFLLPNDELKYYQDFSGAFQNDIQFLIGYRFNLLQLELKIKFISFGYGSNVNCRPYNAPGKVLKKNKLAFDDIVDVSGIV